MAHIVPGSNQALGDGLAVVADVGCVRERIRVARIELPRMTGLPAVGFQTVACSGPTPSLEFVPTMSESITWSGAKVPPAFGACGAIGRAKHIPSPRAGAGNSTELTIFPFPLYLVAA